MRRTPVVGAVYGGAKTFSETVLTDKGSSFKQVVMVEFPRKGVFSIGFITSHELEEAQAKTAQVVTCVFVPTTPNPTTGFIVLVPKDEVVIMDMTVDEAFKMMLTLGVVVPTWTNRPVGGRLAPQQAIVTSRPFWKFRPRGPGRPAPSNMPMRTHYCGEVKERLVGSTVAVAGCSTVVLRAIVLLRMLGFAKLHIYGFDSCLAENNEHHAYAQPENDLTHSVAVEVGGCTFNCHRWMWSQAHEFMDQMRALGDEIEIAVYGDGLIAHILRTAAELPIPPGAEEKHYFIVDEEEIPAPMTTEVSATT